MPRVLAAHWGLAPINRGRGPSRFARAWSWGVRRLSRLAPRVSRRARRGEGQTWSMESCCDPSAHIKGERKGSGERRGGLGETYLFLQLRRLRDGLRGAGVRCKPLVVFVGHADLGVVSPSKFFHRRVVDFKI